MQLKPIHYPEVIENNYLPKDFLHAMELQLGEEFPLFVESLRQVPPVSIHVNPFKKTTWPDLESVPWHPELGRYLPERPVFTLDPLFHAGAYYVQEASSMLVAWLLHQIIDFKQKLRVLDLCAAPGGKSTLVASSLNQQSWLLSNEVIRGRYGVLEENIQKWGLPNMHSSQHDPEDFEALSGFFDIVLVDAPCSGEGLFRRDPAAAAEWSPDLVNLCSARQKRILSNAAPLLKPGGILLYSTCTYNEQENRENSEWLMQEAGLSLLHPDIPENWGVLKTEFGYQCYPHKVQGEGFYIAAFRKEGEEIIFKKKKTKGFRALEKLPLKQSEQLKPWIKEPEKLLFLQTPKGMVRALPVESLEDLEVADTALKRLGLGIEIGHWKGSQFIPSHPLALSSILNLSVPAAGLDKEQALIFLKKEIPEFTPPQQGWLLASYKDLGLGWMKAVQGRVNNYLPMQSRIRMDLKGPSK